VRPGGGAGVGGQGGAGQGRVRRDGSCLTDGQTSGSPGIDTVKAEE
jgi:hypothetical protein